MATIEKRIDFIYLFDVQDGNPNGDPDAGNQPRIDMETGQGIVTDVCLKRKIRNYVQIAKTENGKTEEGFDIFIQDKAVLDLLVNKVYETPGTEDAIDKENGKKDKSDAKKKKVISKEDARKALCHKYYDIRTFGAVIATEGKQDQVRGPIQLTFARSKSPINPKNNAITRMAVTKEADRNKEKTMGSKATVPYALYVCYGFVSANLAQQTKFSEDDLKLFWKALIEMFDHDHSAARGFMAARQLIVFKHTSALGDAPASTLFDLVKIEEKKERVKENNGVTRSFNDYSVTNKEDVKKKLEELKLDKKISVEYMNDLIDYGKET